MSITHELSQFARFINYAASHKREERQRRLRTFVITIRDDDRHFELIDAVLSYIKSESEKGAEWTTVAVKEVP